MRGLPVWESVTALAAGALAAWAVGRCAAASDAVDWRALAALSHAQDVLHQGDGINLAYIGFVEPPLPGLLQLPAAWLLPAMVASGAAVCVFGAGVAAFTLRTILALGADLGLGRPARWLVALLGFANPIYLGWIATGSPDALYVLLLIGGAWALMRWQRDGSLRDLIACSLFLGLALLTRYDALLPAGVAAVVIAWGAVRRGGRWPELEGTVITFLLPIAYAAGLWVLANWAIMGDPWYFLHTSPPRATPAAAGVGGWEAILRSAVAFPPLLAAIWWAFWGGASGRPRLAAGPALVLIAPALALLVLPGLFAGWVGRASETGLPMMPLPDLFAPFLAAGWVLSACALSDVWPLFRRKTYSKEVCLAGSGALLATGCLLVLGPDERVYVDPRPALIGQPLGAADAGPTKEAAALVRRSLPPGLGGSLVVGGWPGYAVTLYAGRVKDKLLLVDASPPRQPLGIGPVSGLLVRDGQTALSDAATRRGWERALGATLAKGPTWATGEWAYYAAGGVSPARTPP